MPDSCEHLEFRADVAVHRLTDVEGGPVTAYSADVHIACAACEEAFTFVGCKTGLSPREPMVSLDAEELRVPIVPSSAPEGFGQTMAGFAVRMRIARDGHDA